MSPSKLLFLPGALGNVEFWGPVSRALTSEAQKIHIGYPGFGFLPPNGDVNELDDLVSLVIKEIDQPTAIVAQSMGGVLAIRQPCKSLVL